MTSQFQSVLSPGSRSRAMAVFPSVVARVFNFINRAVRQDAPESLDHYFADFAKATPIVSVVFVSVGNAFVLHGFNHGELPWKKIYPRNRGISP